MTGEDRGRPPAARSPAPAHHARGGVAATLVRALEEPFPGRALFGRIEHVAKVEAGYAYRLRLVGVALGSTVAAYVKPVALDTVYGDAPVSWTLFARLALGL